MSIFKEGIHYVNCPHCNECKELNAWSHKYRATQLGKIGVVCNKCGLTFKIVHHATFTAEKL